MMFLVYLCAWASALRALRGTRRVATENLLRLQLDCRLGRRGEKLTPHIFQQNRRDRASRHADTVGAHLCQRRIHPRCNSAAPALHQIAAPTRVSGARLRGRKASRSALEDEMTGAQQGLAVGAGHSLYRLCGAEAIFGTARRPSNDDGRA